MKPDIITNILNELGLGWTNIVNGLIGATAWAIHKKTKFWASVRQIFVGGLVAGYSTPFLSKELSIQSIGFFSFVLGIIGLVVIDNIYLWAAKKIKILFN